MKLNLKHLLLISSLTLLSATASAVVDEPAMPDLFSSLTESQSISASTSLGIDPGKLFLSENAIVTVYFLGEGAGYKNSFGWYDATLDPTIAENRNIIWSNASGTAAGLGGGGDLAVGDSVSLGELSAGTELGFFLIANGYNNPNGDIFYTETTFNSDGIDHVIAGATGADGLLALGFEDLLGGGDQDYNDLMIAIDIGIENVVQVVAAAPEPAVWALIIVGLMMTLSKNLVFPGRAG